MPVNKFTIFVIIFAAALLLGGLALAMTGSASFNVGLNVTSPISGYIKSAAPEGRIGAEGTNWDGLVFITIKKSGVTKFQMSEVTSTDVLGRHLSPIDFTGVTPDTYDIYIEGHQSLTRKMSGVALVEGLNRLNFTQPDNSTATGTVRLLAGDISGATSSPGVMGDDVVNAVDLDILISHLDQDDPTGRGIRANLNQDPVINSVDMSLMLDNLDKEGDQ